MGPSRPAARAPLFFGMLAQPLAGCLRERPGRVAPAALRLHRAPRSGLPTRGVRPATQAVRQQTGFSELSTRSSLCCGLPCHSGPRTFGTRRWAAPAGSRHLAAFKPPCTALPCLALWGLRACTVCNRPCRRQALRLAALDLLVQLGTSAAASVDGAAPGLLACVDLLAPLPALSRSSSQATKDSCRAQVCAAPV